MFRVIESSYLQTKEEIHLIFNYTDLTIVSSCPEMRCLFKSKSPIVSDKVDMYLRSPGIIVTNRMSFSHFVQLLSILSNSSRSRPLRLKEPDSFVLILPYKLYFVLLKVCFWSKSDTITITINTIYNLIYNQRSSLCMFNYGNPFCLSIKLPVHGLKLRRF